MKLASSFDVRLSANDQTANLPFSCLSVFSHAFQPDKIKISYYDTLFEPLKTIRHSDSEV